MTTLFSQTTQPIDDERRARIEALRGRHGRRQTNPDRIPGLSDRDSRIVRMQQLRGQVDEEEIETLRRGDVPGRVAGSAIAGTMGVAQGALFIPTAIERILTSAIQAGSGGAIDLTGPMERLQQQFGLAQEVLQTELGLGVEADVTEIVGNVVGGIGGGWGGVLTRSPGAQSLAVRLLGDRFGSGFLRFMSLPQMAAAASRGERTRAQASAAAKLAADGVLFDVGVFPDNTGTSIILAGSLGAVGGGAGTAIAQRLATRRVRKLAEQAGLPSDVPVDVLEGVLSGVDNVPITLTRYLANTHSQDELLRSAALFENQLSDQLLTGIALTLQDAGEKGAIGSIRGVNLTTDQFYEIQRAFPNYEFDVLIEEGIGPTLLYGLKPELREGRALGFLTDSAKNFYRRHGFFLGQRAQYRGQEVRVTGLGPQRDRLKIQMPGNPENAKTIVSADEVLMLDDAAPRFGGGTDLYPRFRAMQEVFDGTWEEAFDVFFRQLNLDPGLRQPLRDFLGGRAAQDLAEEIAPSAKELLRNFRRALTKAQSTTEAQWSVGEHAAARGFLAHRLRDGRVQFTRISDGTPSGWMSQRQAMDWLSEYRVIDAPNFTPDLEIPEEALHGIAQIGRTPPNPSRPPDLEGAGIDELLRNTNRRTWDRALQPIGRFIQGAEEYGQVLERTTGHKIWSQAIQPVSKASTDAHNRARPFMERLRNISSLVSRDRHDLLRGWMLSDLPETFARSNHMTKKEVRAARLLRKLYNDLFREFSESAGTDLSPDDFLKNYVPDIVEYVERAGTLDIERFWHDRGRRLPREAEFFGEFFKSGEVQGTEDILMATMKYIRAGFFKTEAGRTWEDALQLAKTVTDEEAQRHLVEYLIAQRGIPNLSQQAMQKFSQRFLRDVGVQVRPDEINSLLNDLMAMNASALMGFRPGLLIRNLTQPFMLGAPLLPNGFRRTWSGMRAARTDAGRRYVQEIGAVRKQTPLARGDLLDDASMMAGESRQRIRNVARASLKWYSSTDDFNRAAAAISVRDGLDNARASWFAGELTTEELLATSGLHVQDPVKTARFLEILQEGTEEAFDEARDFAAREFANHINFLYGSANAPRWVRTGFGKFFGTFGTWPMGYINWARHIADAPISKNEKIRIFSKHGLATMSVLTPAAYSGANVNNWVGFMTPIYTGGPMIQPAADMFTVMRGVSVQFSGYEAPPDYNIALQRLTSGQYTRLLVPGATLARDVQRAGERVSEGRTGLAILESLGVRTDPGPAVPPRLVPGEPADDVRSSLEPVPELGAAPEPQPTPAAVLPQ